MKKRALLFVFTGVFFLNTMTASAQCSMCSLNAENSVKNGNTQGKGLNNGILYLLCMPYLLVAGVGFLWYKKYKANNTQQTNKHLN